MKHHLFIMTLLISGGLFAGCASCKHAEQPSYPLTEVSYSSGGGFSGFYTGYTIKPDRVVTRWNGRGGIPSSVDTIGTVDEQRYHTLLQKIYAAEPAQIQQQQTGNMTTALTIVSNDEQYLYTWEGIHTDTEAVPQSTLPLHAAVWQLLQEMDPELQ
ncbi:MAG: hypothetical protein C0600_05590 [Ignavibacteria bacterium]|nr:MAG: hypothetical protein C0600_05590 [Ignavibacteria bacterium]